MTVTHKFSIHVGPSPTPPMGYTVFVDSSTLVADLTDLGIQAKPIFGDATYFDIALEQNSPVLTKVYQLLADNGYKPISPDVIAAPGGSRFDVKRLRSYEQSDLDAATLLRIDRPTVELADFADLLEDDSLVVASAEIARAQFGTLYPLSSYGFADKTKAALESFGLAGIEFRPIYTQVDGELASSHLWHLTSSIVMPACLLPRLNHDYQQLREDETLSKSAYWFGMSRGHG